MNRFFLKVNGLNHCPNGIAHPRDASDWEGGKVLIPADSPHRFGRREEAPAIAESDELWVWTHEHEDHGRGCGLTAKATASGITEEGVFKGVILQNVSLLARPFGLRVLGDDPTGSRLLDEVRRSRHHDAYLIEDEDYPDFIKIVETRNAPLPDEIQDRYLQGWEREIHRHNKALLQGLAERCTATVKPRPMQGAFRDALFDLYAGRCVVTGCAVPEALEAAHIMPHTGDPVWDQPDNGLLLRRDLHTMFDAFLWSLHPNTGRLALASRLKTSYYQRLSGQVVRHQAATELLSVHFKQFKKREDDRFMEASSA